MFKKINVHFSTNEHRKKNNQHFLLRHIQDPKKNASV